ncbi:MAG: bifunctional diaminohydroxyphosphoribosylaminopyrimidine deaminase/5-amino-6-(5-phosphoribosylamino)uracil reductase RibD [Lachnospiraceae bacterium]|nr:bifunctional diaminohydroxyphosphoribosylaminopyrimidine deaminase/5-amino-6-(5-phosphoribosylamino)uracil reductase RibD [Lachnospiraceae bacterium]
MEQEQRQYMKRALELAKKGMGYTAPNPMVGCVVVKEGQVIAEGYHERYGEFHAERNALQNCIKDPKGADLYVTLEPCCHYGKTPPCIELILEKGIKRVFIGAMDPNPLVGGKGAALLREHGVLVETGLMEEECLKLNEAFFHYITENRPFMVMKYAMTIDGKIVAKTGDARWVTGEQARNQVQLLRKQYSGILVGIETVLADNPMLNVRIEDGVDPLRIILDSHLRIPLDSQIVSTAKKIPTMVVCKEKEIDIEKQNFLEKAGVQVLVQKGSGKVDLKELCEELGRQKIDSVLIEGGSRIHGAFLSAGLVDKIYVYLAPKFAGESPYEPVKGWFIEKMSDACSLRLEKIEQIGEDVCITAYPQKRKQE